MDNNTMFLTFALGMVAGCAMAMLALKVGEWLALRAIQERVMAQIVAERPSSLPPHTLVVDDVAEFEALERYLTRVAQASRRDAQRTH